MQTTSPTEYLYQDARTSHHHAYQIKPLLDLLEQAIATPSSDKNRKPRILDLGCGNGSLTSFIAQQGFEVVGIEESASGVELAAQSYPDCRFLQSSIYDLPTAQLGEKFDIIVSVEVIEHLVYPKQLIKAAKEHLKPRGRLILTTPYHGYLKNLTLALSGKMDQHFTVLWEGGHIKFFSVSTLSQLLTQEGCTDIQFKFAGRMPYLWKSMLCSCQMEG
jgi:2-polyprenyl-3-methyl-5-hydroxy-6-metoxy-1,4-benzoquinol methylase